MIYLQRNAEKCYWAKHCEWQARIIAPQQGLRRAIAKKD
jgi:hypothetical protein